MNTCNTSLDIDILFQLRTDFNCLLMNLIVGELLVSMFGIPVDAWAAIRQGWKLGYHLCITLGFSLTLLGEIPANILLSIDSEWIQRSRCISISSAHSIFFYGKIAHHYHGNFSSKGSFDLLSSGMNSILSLTSISIFRWIVLSRQVIFSHSYNNQFIILFYIL